MASVFWDANGILLKEVTELIPLSGPTGAIERRTNYEKLHHMKKKKVLFYHGNRDVIKNNLFYNVDE